MCVHQTWVVLVATTISTGAPTPILSVRVRPPLDMTSELGFATNTVAVPKVG